MGTDVHAFFEARTDGGWKRVQSAWEQNRHYFLFSWLADVRNGFGFAGTPTYSPVKPIAAPKGLPDDFKLDEDGEGGEYVGDHSFSWLTADEILSAKRPGATWQTGIIPRAEFDEWDGHTPPKAWSGMISGKGIVVAESPTDVTPESTHVRVWFLRPGDELDYFVDEIKRLKDEHGEVRMVFGFDS